MGTFRFLLALAVALNHFGAVWGYAIMNGRMAVQCFFMISGFLISLVLSQKYDPGTSDGRWLFYTNRALRIFVPYWSFCLMILVVHLLIYLILGARFGVDAAFAAHWHEMTWVTRLYLLFSNLLIVSQEWTMWLAYQDGAMVPVWSSDLHSPHLGAFQVIPQAWSISLELMFYALAPFLLRWRSSVLLAIIVATYVLRSLAQAHGFDGSGFVYRFFPFEIGLFLAGALSHRAYAHLAARGLMWPKVSLAIAGAMIALVLVQQFLDRLDNHTFYIPVVLALPALFHVSRRFPLDAWLGELSYPIYLVHLAILGAGQAMIAALLGAVDRNWLALAMTIVTVLAAAAYVHWIDAPFERWRQRRVVRARRSAASDGFARPKEVTLSA